MRLPPLSLSAIGGALLGTTAYELLRMFADKANRVILETPEPRMLGNFVGGEVGSFVLPPEVAAFDYCRDTSRRHDHWTVFALMVRGDLVPLYDAPTEAHARLYIFRISALLEKHYGAATDPEPESERATALA